MGLPQEYQIYPAVSGYGMRKVILDMLVTLNFFFEGPNGELDWTFIFGMKNSKNIVIMN
jgi:hypothetical protein